MPLGVATLSMSAQNQNESESLSKDQSKALRDSLAQATDVLPRYLSRKYRPSSEKGCLEYPAQAVAICQG